MRNRHGSISSSHHTLAPGCLLLKMPESDIFQMVPILNLTNPTFVRKKALGQRSLSEQFNKIFPHKYELINHHI